MVIDVKVEDTTLQVVTCSQVYPPEPGAHSFDRALQANKNYDKCKRLSVYTKRYVSLSVPYFVTQYNYS